LVKNRESRNPNGEKPNKELLETMIDNFPEYKIIDKVKGCMLKKHRLRAHVPYRGLKWVGG